MITVFSAMRPFIGSIGQVQLSAIQSWLSLGPECQVVLVDDEEGTTPQAVAQLDVEVIKDVKRSRLGAPLLDDLLRVGADTARFELLAFNTADVLLPPNFVDAAVTLHQLMDGRDFFASGSRFDLLEPVEFEIGSDGWFSVVQLAVERVGRARRHTALDLWVYPKSLRWDAPPMPIGRGGMDGWAVWKMRTAGVSVIDFSEDITLVHQYHDRPARRDPLFHEEFLECLELFESMAENAMGLWDADWMLVNGKLQRPKGLRRVHSALSLFHPWRLLVGQRRRMQLPHLYGQAKH